MPDCHDKPLYREILDTRVLSYFISYVRIHVLKPDVNRVTMMSHQNYNYFVKVMF